jgi:hypothetical protein
VNDVKLTLSFGEETGTDRGGVDVWLQVELTTDTDPGSQLTQRVNAAFDEWLVSVPHVVGGQFWEGGVVVCEADEADAEVWVEDGRVKTQTANHYDFSVDQPVEKVRELVCWLALTGLNEGPPGYNSERHLSESEWVYSLRTRTYKLTAKLFRYGNAE